METIIKTLLCYTNMWILVLLETLPVAALVVIWGGGGAAAAVDVSMLTTPPCLIVHFGQAILLPTYLIYALN